MKTPSASIFRLTRAMCALATSAALLASFPTAHAGKPGGGGSATPAGTIYFYSPPYQGSGLDYSMKADGTQKTSLGISGDASPGRLTHGGKRWFLQSRQVPGSTPGGSVRWESFAVGEDGAA